MSEELMITQQDLIDWLDRPPSNDDLDLATFISTRLENFYKLQNQLQQKENIIKEAREYIKNHLERENFDYDILETNTIYNRDLYKVLKILDKGSDKE